MDVAVAHFLDASEQRPDGLYDYYYEGDNYTFSGGGDQVLVRTYDDQPGTAFFLRRSCRQIPESSLAQEARQYLSSRGVTTFKCIGSSGAGYEQIYPEHVSGVTGRIARRSLWSRWSKRA